MEIWAKERIYACGNQMEKTDIKVFDYYFGVESYYILFSSIQLIEHLSIFQENLGYIPIMIDGTYRLDHSDHKFSLLWPF